MNSPIQEDSPHERLRRERKIRVIVASLLLFAGLTFLLHPSAWEYLANLYLTGMQTHPYLTNAIVFSLLFGALGNIINQVFCERDTSFIAKRTLWLVVFSFAVNFPFTYFIRVNAPQVTTSIIGQAIWLNAGFGTIFAILWVLWTAIGKKNNYEFTKSVVEFGRRLTTEIGTRENDRWAKETFGMEREVVIGPVKLFWFSNLFPFGFFLLMNNTVWNFIMWCNIAYLTGHEVLACAVENILWGIGLSFVLGLMGMSLPKRLRELRKMNREYELDIDLERLNEVLHDYLPADQLERWISDEGHGFPHSLQVVEMALQLAQTEQGDGKPIDYASLVLGALFHDIYAVMPDRGKHDTVGARQTEEILKRSGFSQEIIHRACSAVRNHRKKPSEFPPDAPIEARIVRDADTILETLDLERIRWVSMVDKKRDFFNPDLTIDDRMEVLASEDTLVTEHERIDCLQFLLRNVTKGLNPTWYLTTSARNRIEEAGLFERNMEKILAYAGEHASTQLGQIRDAIDKVVRRYRDENGIGLV